jgi:hypothetical protein
MSDYSYSLSTKKTWRETYIELSDTMDKWGIISWKVTEPKGAKKEVFNQSDEERTITLTYLLRGRTISLTMGKQDRAVDNLRVLFLAVEAMRLNERRGISDVLESAYLQLAAPTQEIDPYELLEIRPDASLEVAEAVYKAKVRNIHPDRGGSTEHMKIFNKAIEEIRKKLK